MDISSFHDLAVFLGRILLAAVLGAALGLERDKHGRGAGLRTHLLVCMGGCVFTILSSQVEAFGIQILSPNDFTRVTDPGRIGAQVVSGIGFLGAGVILKEGLSIRGLTTAACLWVAAAIGMAAGVGFYIIATFTTGLALFALVALRWSENFYTKDVYRTLSLTVENGIDLIDLVKAVENDDVKVNSYSVKRNYKDKVTRIEMSLCVQSKADAETLSYVIIKTLEKRVPMLALEWVRP